MKRKSIFGLTAAGLAAGMLLLSCQKQTAEPEMTLPDVPVSTTAAAYTARQFFTTSGNLLSTAGWNALEAAFQKMQTYYAVGGMLEYMMNDGVTLNIAVIDETNSNSSLYYNPATKEIIGYEVPNRMTEKYVKELLFALYNHWCYGYYFRYIYVDPIQNLYLAVNFQASLFCTQVYQHIGYAGQYDIQGLNPNSQGSTWYNDIRTVSNGFSRGISKENIVVLYNKYKASGAPDMYPWSEIIIPIESWQMRIGNTEID